MIENITLKESIKAYKVRVMMYKNLYNSKKITKSEFEDKIKYECQVISDFVFIFRDYNLISFNDFTKANDIIIDFDNKISNYYLTNA